jgi:uncharacterized metal-binding protein
MNSLPLVYACAGCSHAGRVSYEVAQALTQQGAAEMSCLAGVAAELPVFLRLMEKRDVWVIDGCPLECAKGVFDKLDRPIDRHIRLREYGVAKNGPRSAELTPEEIARCICPRGVEKTLCALAAAR